MYWLQGSVAAFSFVGACIGLLLVIYTNLHRRASRSARSQGLPLPPGPPPLPIVGNLLDIPRTAPWEAYRELSRKYGSIISLRSMGRTLIVVNDFDLAIDIMEKHSAVFSSRPRSPLPSLLNIDWSLVFMPYDHEWRRHRRIFSHHFHPSTVNKYIPFQEESAHELLLRLLNDAGKFDGHLRYTIATSIIRATYGLEVAPKDDKVITTFEEAVKCVDLLLSGASMLEYFPVLAKIPTWLPGARLQRRLAQYKKVLGDLRDLPWGIARDAITAGKAPDCVARTMVENMSQVANLETAAVEDTDSRSVAASGYSAGIDTLYAALASFFMAMSIYPEVQRKAQDELDTVVGSGRLPKLQDRDALPYVSALIKEAMRWHTVAPFGTPHSSSADEEFNGYFIPKDANIMVNMWSLLHDPKTYPQPDEFIPERFLKDGKLNPSIQDPSKIAFGWGRRICPGKDYAENTVFIYIAYILHTFDITPPLDERGQPIHIKPQPTAGIISYIEDCRCTVKPRSTAERLILGEHSEANPQ